MGRERVLGARSHSAPNPRRIFAYFLCVQKVGRRQAKPDRPFLLALSKEMELEEKRARTQSLHNTPRRGRKKEDHNGLF